MRWGRRRPDDKAFLSPDAPEWDMRLRLSVVLLAVLPFLAPEPAGAEPPWLLAMPHMRPSGGGAVQLAEPPAPGLPIPGSPIPGMRSPGPAPAALGAAAQPPGSAWTLCRPAIARAERAYGVPDHLLAAIARVESGRRAPGSGAWQAWPWTIDAEGEGQFLDSKPAAIAAVRALQARGVASIDVGCLQVNLMHHPHAFASLEEAFDPDANAAYAARFLTQLYQQAGTWPQAAALYHSATPALAADYQRKVLAAWPEERAFAGLGPVPAMASPGLATSGSGAGMATLSAFARAPPARVIPLAGAAPAAAALRRDLAAYRAAPVLLAAAPPPPVPADAAGPAPVFRPLR